MILKLLRLVVVNDYLIYYIYNLFPVIFNYKKEKGDFDGL
jgi:hypothetical protein|tara:strand:+ start:49 stop:168 length:120 start_codon:yes stop_codon:yes gene_type:complete